MPVQYQNILLLLSEEISFGHNHVFYKIGDVTDYVYVIING